MKKFIASVIVCGFAVAMVACGGKKAEETTATDSVAVVDTTAAKVDSTVNAVVDSAAVVK